MLPRAVDPIQTWTTVRHRSNSDVDDPNIQNQNHSSRDRAPMPSLARWWSTTLSTSIGINDTKNQFVQGQSINAIPGLLVVDDFSNIVWHGLFDFDRRPNRFNSDVNDFKKHCFNSDVNTARLLDAKNDDTNLPDTSVVDDFY